MTLVSYIRGELSFLSPLKCLRLETQIAVALQQVSHLARARAQKRPTEVGGRLAPVANSAHPTRRPIDCLCVCARARWKLSNFLSPDSGSFQAAS